MVQRQKRESGKGSASESMATEEPVPTERAVVQYVVSVDVTTGAWLKIEKIDEQSGKRTELSQQEYAQAFAVASYSAPYFAAQAASFHDPLQSPAVQSYLAYLKSIADYLQTNVASG